MKPIGSLRIEQRHLACFSPDDRIFLRDPRGRSPRPSLQLEWTRPYPILRAVGPFLLRYDYTVRREQGVRFVEVTGDPNRIHREGDIVAGALTASKIIAPLEVLCPSLQIHAVQLKFMGLCRYGSRVRSTFLFRPAPDANLTVEVKAFQNDHQIVSAEVRGVMLQAPPRVAVRERRVNARGLEAVREYFAALGIDSTGYFDKGDFTDYTYPFGYVLSLPTGEIVRQMAGQGGILNVLRLETADSQKIPITGADLPAVRLIRPRPKRTFNRILADIIQGVVTYYTGSLIVNPGMDLPA